MQLHAMAQIPPYMPIYMPRHWCHGLQLHEERPEGLRFWCLRASKFPSFSPCLAQLLTQPGKIFSPSVVAYNSTFQAQIKLPAQG